MMSAMVWSLWGVMAAAVVVAAAVCWVIRQRNMQRWLGGYVVRRAEWRNDLAAEAPVDVFIAICDHYEPECYGASRQTAMARVRRWVQEYPQTFGPFQDAGGRPPQHSFFYPQDEYRPEYLDELAKLCRAGYGEVDVHLHHDHDTADALREKLEDFRQTLFHRHGLLRKDPASGEIVYGFIHGNWALCNSRPDSRWCGVDQELTVLIETGCYADFTLPSAPSAAQTSTINSIYYARDLPGRRKSHDRGIRARVGTPAPAEHLLMIQGPLSLDWQSRKLGIVPSIENGDVTAGRAASWRRMRHWLDVGVHVAGRPEWKFVKLHTHGCKDGNIDTLLGPEMHDFHAHLAQRAAAHAGFRYHYVTAWEMAQLVHLAEAGGRAEGKITNPSAAVHAPAAVESAVR